MLKTPQAFYRDIYSFLYQLHRQINPDSSCQSGKPRLLSLTSRKPLYLSRFFAYKGEQYMQSNYLYLNLDDIERQVQDFSFFLCQFRVSLVLYLLGYGQKRFPLLTPLRQCAYAPFIFIIAKNKKGWQ